MKEKIESILKATPLSISQTRRAGSNGLRNAEEITASILEALSSEPELETLENGNITIDLKRRLLFIGETETFITVKELKLLEFFMRNVDEALPYRKILTAVWGPAHVDDVQYLRVFIGQVRKIIGADIIISLPGVGYKMKALDGGNSVIDKLKFAEEAFERIIEDNTSPATGRISGSGIVAEEALDRLRAKK